MKALVKCLFLSLVLSACSGGGGGSGEMSASTSGSGGTVIVAAQVQVPQDIKEELASQPQYQIDADEIELLFSEGAITEEQKQELLALLQ